MSESQFTKAGFLKAYALPALLLLVIPLLGFWFSGHAIGRYDGQVRENTLAALAKNPKLGTEEKQQRAEWYSTHPASVSCRAEPTAAMEKLCAAYAPFFWIRTASSLCLALGCAAFVLSLLLVALSFLSQRALYWSFAAGWNLLKVVSLGQVVGQGFIAVMLSYWMTALWFEKVSVKLILVVGALAALAAFLVVVAIFKRIDGTAGVDGVLLAEAQAPRFWSHVRGLCSALGTEPPAQIAVGIDDNFFVTENPIVIQGRRCTGRTLFVSLSLLKVLEKAEADAVLAHEMAHFSGEDTLFSKRMSPMLGRYQLYLAALYEGGVSRPVFYFMLFFWSLFQLSLSRLSRQREHRADGIAASTTSPLSVGRALVKVSAYSSYRGRIEKALFSENRQLDQLGISSRVSSGFASYVSSPALRDDLSGAAFPHPFDTHPLLAARLQSVAAPITPADYDRLLAEPIAEPWTVAIEGATQLEERLWAAYEKQFAEAHERSLPYRYLPSTPEERAVVEKYFPSVQVETKQRDASIAFTCEQLYYSAWAAPVRYVDITKAAVDSGVTGRKYLALTHGPGGAKEKIPLVDFDEASVLERFNRYYGRYKAAQQAVAAAPAR
jgi:Zn-dependent protease with chaperone function